MSDPDPEASAQSVSHPLKETVERLLYEDESNVLDFKEEQYPFGGATKEQLSELIKDVLAMANSWGRADTRFILVGVREVAGDRSVVTGVIEHLPEHALQQLVNGRTNRVVELSYHAVPIDGMTVGVIAIPKQQRPVFLNRSYGALAANTVYVRRGSSTAEAKPDEIAQMGAPEHIHDAAQPADLEVELAFPDTRETYTSGLETEVDCLHVPAPSDLPDYERTPSPFSIYAGLGPNRDYYRDLARYLWALKSTLPLGFFVNNVGEKAAGNVMVRMEVEAGSGYTVLAEPVPEPDEQLTFTNALIERAEEQSRPYRPKLREGARLEVKYDLGTIQPGLYVFTDPFYLVVQQPGVLKLKVRLYSDQLPAPKEYEFEVHARGQVTYPSSEDIVRIGNEALGRSS